jgi:hypothetical protein
LATEAVDCALVHPINSGAMKTQVHTKHAMPTCTQWNTTTQIQTYTQTQEDGQIDR